MTHVTIPCNSSGLHDFVRDGVKEFAELTTEELSRGVKVFVNGAWLGIAKAPVALYQSLKQKKLKGIINIYTSITF